MKPAYFFNQKKNFQRLPLLRMIRSGVFVLPLRANKQLINYRSLCALAGQMAEHSFVLDLFVTFWGKAKK
jgi:hypothetical protein